MCGGVISPPLVVKPSFCVGVRLSGVAIPSFCEAGKPQLTPTPSYEVAAHVARHSLASPSCGFPFPAPIDSPVPELARDNRER